MNILELYDRYRKQHATEFRNRLEAVAKSVLKMTENVPEEQAIKIFQTSSDREWFDIFENKSHPEHKEGFLLTLEKTPSYAGGNRKLIVMHRVTKIPTQI